MIPPSYPITDAENAIVNGLSDGGCEMAFNFPGFKSHNIFSLLGGRQISLNEKVAYEEAYGASLSGKRTVVSFKNVGLSVAADAFLNSLVSGTNAGLVVIVTEDTDVSDSQNLMDSRNYQEFYGGLWLEPYDMQSAYDLSYFSFAWSEKFNLPVVIRLTSQLFDVKGKYKIQSRKAFTGNLVFDHSQFIVHPTNWKKQNIILIKKNLRIRKFVENMYSRIYTPSNNTIVFGACEREIKKENLSRDNYLQIYTYPIPESKIWKLISNKRAIKVYETGGTYGLDKINQYVGRKASVLIKPKNKTPDLSSTYRIWTDLEMLFRIINKINPDYVISDLTQFTRESTDTVDCCLCLGSGISVGIGFALAGYKKVVSIVGDASFMHSGTDILSEAIIRKIKLMVIIVDNGGSWCTGNQKPIPLTLMRKVKNMLYHKIKYKDVTESQLEKIIKKLQKNNSVSVLHIVIN